MHDYPTLCSWLKSTEYSQRYNVQSRLILYSLSTHKAYLTSLYSGCWLMHICPSFCVLFRWDAKPAWCFSSISLWPTSSGCWWRVCTSTLCWLSFSRKIDTLLSTCSSAGVGTFSYSLFDFESNGHVGAFTLL